MKLRGKARQRERARRRAAGHQQVAPMAMSQDRRQAMLCQRGADLAVIVGREDECIAALTQALELDPDDFRSRLTLSFVLLRLGQYERAWPHYSEAMGEDGRDAPEWLGQSLKGCAIAMRVDPDPALGDWSFGARYVRPLMDRAAKVVVEVPTKLRSMAHNWSDVEVVHKGDPMPDIDYEVTAMFIPPAFRTTLESIPPCPYITPPADRVEHWRQRLPRNGKRLVAIGWTGDGDDTVRKWRSVPLAQVKEIVATPDVQFVSVERFLPADAAARLSALSNVIHVGDQVSDDMGELASVLSICDHTIIVDNTTAHVAGALGRPMSLMLTDGAAGGEWRWHCVGRDHSPWYPSARIFRRTEHGDWSDVVEQVCAAGFAGTLRAAA
jgi:hypothetical protein